MDSALLDLLTGPQSMKMMARRDAALDPLLLAAATASGPHVTRNHYHHDFFPGIVLPKADTNWKSTSDGPASKPESKRFTYVSRQAPRRVRLQQGDLGKENQDLDPLKPAENLPQTTVQQQRRRQSIVSAASTASADAENKPKLPTTLKGPLQVKCMARTRIPTPHGPVFLHLYHNNRDTKEHLAIVVDPAQFSPQQPQDYPSAPSIRSRSLDAVWSENETEMERIVRGAYIGKLSPDSLHTSPSSSSTPSTSSSAAAAAAADIPSPLIRIHSECFTGETIGSMRCDCGEQLDEAIRQISQPIPVPSLSSATTGSSTTTTTIPGRGAVIYLRQEGRGIGLLSKIRAYNLQDLGHDTVAANLLLGHKADERNYDIACAILRDLGLGVEAELGEGVRVLTNNPDKVKALEKEGIRVVERVPMVPKSWTVRDGDHLHDGVSVSGAANGGVTALGGKAVYGEDLDRYLKTKVEKMGHMLPLWMQDSPLSS